MASSSDSVVGAGPIIARDVSAPAHDKVAFANALRGIAAVSVILAHYLDVYWMAPLGIAGLIGAPPGPPPPGWIAMLDAVLPLGDLGFFGVALFFLISGFVIPFAFLRSGRTAFAVGRLFRLWPTYAVGLSLSALAAAICAHAFQRPAPYSATTFLAQLSFVRMELWIPSMDGIDWTLDIEVQFYLLALLLAPAIRSGAVGRILSSAGLIGLVVVAARHLPGWHVSNTLLFRMLYNVSLSGQMICFMLIGTVLNLRFRQRIGRPAASGAILVLLGLFVLQWSVGIRDGLPVRGMITYAVALAVFCAAYLGRKRFVRTPGLLGWLADISYPLYVVHGVTGYVIMRLAMGAGVPAWLALVCAFGFAFAGAWLLHIAVEVPSHRMGHHLGRRLNHSPLPARVT